MLITAPNPSRNHGRSSVPGRRHPSVVATSTAVAWGAIAVLSLHVVDDSFLQPAGGTSASDHLVSGLAPLERDRIGGLGLSVGGEMMLQTAAGSKDLAAIVSDGAGARVA